MIIERAPGKLFVAGEYAVVEPGEPSVLVAVDRYIIVELTESDSAGGTISSPQYGALSRTWTREADGGIADDDHRPPDFVLSTLSVVEQLVAERGLPARSYDISISSELDDVSGRKFGLGSSAAVTVATVKVLDRFYGLGLSTRQIYMVALIASVRVAPTLSGGDIASSAYGGWIAYSAPDRADVLAACYRDTVSEMLERDWPGLSIERLPAPRELELVVGWTGKPASTEKLVGSMQTSKRGRIGDYQEFLDGSRVCVRGLIAAMRAQSTTAIMDAIRTSRSLLAGLAEASGRVIETPLLTELCESAAEIGAVAKSSGAGGGDCGIVLAPLDADLGRMLSRWEKASIRHLDFGVNDPAVLARRSPTREMPAVAEAASGQRADSPETSGREGSR